MKQTFEELAESKSYSVYERFDDKFETVVNIKDVVELLKLVREKTLEEANNCLNELYNLGEDYKRIDKTDIATFLTKQKILQLDKDSIEI